MYTELILCTAYHADNMFAYNIMTNLWYIFAQCISPNLFLKVIVPVIAYANKSDITCLKTSRETFTYNTHNSAQAKLTAVELHIIVTSLCCNRHPTETEKQSIAVQRKC